MITRRHILGSAFLAPLVAILPGARGSRVLAATKTKVCARSAVPVGTGKVFTVSGRPYLISQPSAGTFRAFRASCTHAGCTLPSPSLGKIRCGCHGAQFNGLTGANTAGPGGSRAGTVGNLPAVTVSVDATYVYVTV